VLPQVLAGLGIVSVVSAGCVAWLQRFQPLFGSVALGTLAYQVWLVCRRPRQRRTRMMRVILWTSFGTNVAIGAALVALWLRYWW
jgi:hypothetical protein